MAVDVDGVVAVVVEVVVVEGEFILLLGDKEEPVVVEGTSTTMFPSIPYSSPAVSEPNPKSVKEKLNNCEASKKLEAPIIK